jgi:hypothetical protein
MAATIAAKKEAKEQVKVNLKYMRDQDAETVRGVFHYYEVPGGLLEFVYKAYREDNVEKYSLEDGKIYTVPRGIARHLNKSGWYPVHAHAVDTDGRPIAKIGQKVRRYGFSSLEFFDSDDLVPEGKPLITIEAAL